uniref:Uncharacterized protein n=1 Tax=Caenorhabditis japonica TaxID=281687 RepID=A0A8R1DR10_CAEJA
MTIGLQQISHESSIWKRIYLLDKTKFVFQDETKLMIHSEAMEDLSEFSKTVYSNCIGALDWIRQQMLNFPIGPVDPNALLHFFSEFLKKMLNSEDVDFYSDDILEPVAKVLKNGISRKSFAYVGVKYMPELERKLKDFFSAPPISEEACFGLACQLICFSCALCLDILSQWLQIKRVDRVLTNFGPKDDCFEFLNPSIYDSRFHNVYAFYKFNRVMSFRKCWFMRDKYKSSIWHQLLYSKSADLMTQVFDYQLIERIPSSTHSILQHYLERLQTKMRQCILTSRLSVVGQSIFCEPPFEFFYRSVSNEKQQRIPKMENYLQVILREMLNDREIGVQLFCDEWESYVLSICNTTEHFIQHHIYMLVVKSLNFETYNRLAGNEINSKERGNQFQFIVAQLLRFVIKFAAHTARIALKLKAANQRITHLKYDGVMEISELQLPAVEKPQFFEPMGKQACPPLQEQDIDSRNFYSHCPHN